MTREAKIGLLVALAFLLVIGILLSDHVTTATREPGAPLASVEGNIRGSIGAPGVSSDEAGPPPVLPREIVADAPPQPYTYQPAVTVTPAPAPLAVATDPWADTGPAAPLPGGALVLAATTGGEPVVPAAAPQPIRPVAPAPVAPPVLALPPTASPAWSSTRPRAATC